MARPKAIQVGSRRPPKESSASTKGKTVAARRSTRSRAAPPADISSQEEHENTGGEDNDNYHEDQEDDVDSLHSDALDDDDDFDGPSGSARKRKRASKSPAKPKSIASPRKKTTRAKRPKTQGSDDDDVLELQEGQEVVGVVVKAPKTGRVPPGQISQNTFDFLAQLQKPECNDREWFKLNEPVYRLAEKEWKNFVEEVTSVIVEADPQIPHLPPKDVIHRIYRDVRFSNDKTPYKRNFSASFSRSGRKGIFAGLRPGGESLLAAGSWQPGKNELATIRNNIVRSSTRLRKIISAPTFVGLFGPAKPHPKGQRQNIFGMEDELKVAPKGIDKTHKDIDLLKCRSFAVVHRFTDKQVLAHDFKEEVGRVVGILRPFVHCLNDMMTVGNAEGSDSDVNDESADEGTPDNEDDE